LNTDYKIFAEEWDAEEETIVIPNEGERSNFLYSIKERLEWDMARFEKVIANMELGHTKFTADDVIAQFQRASKESSLFSFMHQSIAQLKRLGRERTSETYSSTLRSFMAFRNDVDVPLDAITSDLVMLYEAWLKSRGVRMNTISFYMRILRAVYNRAVEKGLTEQQHPFRHVYTGVEKTVKRAVPVKTIKTLKDMDLSLKPPLEKARDLFLFSFYTRGMSFIDMAYLRKSNLQNEILTYHRRKTGQRLTIKWEKCMADIVNKYPVNGTEYLLPIITEEGNERKQYDSAIHTTNYYLRKLSDMLELTRPLTMYVARHSWASAAKASNIPLAVISEGMGHDSESTTQIYLASLESSVVDNANKKILKML